MKQDLSEVEIVIRSTAILGVTGTNIPLAFDYSNPQDVTNSVKGDLFKQNLPFLLVENDLVSSYRVGPSQVSPTRYTGDLHIQFFTKSPNVIADLKFIEEFAKHFAERTIDDVRFRTFTPFSRRIDNGFTLVSGMIEFDFELYRTAR